MNLQLIPKLEKDFDTDHTNELKALGINVIDQLSLEQNVAAEVDEAVKKLNRKQKLQILRREVKESKLELIKLKNKDADFEHRLLGMRQRVTDPRKFIEVEKSYNENREQVKTICRRKEYVEEKLNAASEDLSVLDDVDLNLEEGEMVEEDDDENSLISSVNKDALIKEGKMTPFGTLLNSFDSSENVLTVKPSGTSTYRPNNFEHSTLSDVKNINSDRSIVKAVKTTSYLHDSNSVIATHSTRSAKGHKLKENKTISTFEKYLQDQIDKQKSRSKESSGNLKRKSSSTSGYGNFKRKKVKPKEFNILTDEKSVGKNNHMGDNKTSPLKKRILKPKKHWKEKNMGSITSQLEADQYKTPAGILSERVAFITSDDEKHGSDSDYIPSEEEYLSDEESTRVGQSKTSVVTKSERRTTKTEGKAKRSKRVPDDGYIENYAKRIEQWKKERLNEKHRKIMEGEDLDSDEDDEFERFDGDYKIPLTLWNKLYKYQRTCVKWLWELHCQRCGGILGDEMGLGKTIMIISFLVGLSFSGLLDRDRKHKGLGPVLIVAPATVLHQWVREFHKWWPPFRVAVLHESGVFRGKKSALIHNIHTHDGILITSYRGVVDHIKVLLNYHWHYVILDEGHKIRNPEAQITVAVKRFETAHRLILSGSPIQNGLKELWSLFDFIFPGKLGSLPVFLQQFAVPITQGGYANASKLEVQTSFKCATVLRDTINPYLLRRMKIDVKNHLTLPDKSEQVLFCGLSDDQRAIYRRYIDGNEVKNIMNGRLQVFVGLINLRKICNHPDLYDGGPKHLVHENISDLQPEFQYGWWEKSGKMVVLHSILKLWKKQDHKVLLFTQSRQMMCILEKYLKDETYQYLKMDGGTSVGSRQSIIDRFNSDPSIFVFLLTTRVGGLGTNLTGADRVLIFDPDWNPSTDAQARERAWRIGQTKNVTIYRLLTAGTIEEKIYHRQIFKQFLTNRVLKDPKQQRFFKTNDLHELFTLNEGEKEKTESAAIFAGTGSEIIVRGKEKVKNRNGKEKIEKLNILEEENSVEKIDSSLEVNSKFIDQNTLDDVENNHSDAKEEFETCSRSPCNDNIDKLGEKESFITSENIELDEKINNSSDANSISETDVNCLPENPEHDNIENDVTERLTQVEEPLRGLSENGDLNDDDKKEKMRALAKLLSKKITENKKERKETNRTDDGESSSKRRESKKKNKKKKDGEKRRKKLEGEMIDNLVKKRKYKYSEDTNVEESNLSKKQDDFVLQKLFRSSGVHTALSHDVIINAGDPDYLLLESEADRVAKEALKQVRLSRGQFLRSRKNDADRVRKDKSLPKFGSKRSQLVAIDPKDIKRTNSQSETKSTPKMFNGCVDDEDEENSTSQQGLKKAPSDVTSAPIDEGASSGVLSSAQLLKRMRERNRIKGGNPVNDRSSFEEESYDPDYPSTANLEIPVGEMDPEVQKHVDLLSDIRNFVAFQAKSDGRASTEEVVQRFKDKVPTNQNHIFRALLNQICILVKDSSGQGFWHIKGEFR